jgi:hypothetical protein
MERTPDPDLEAHRNPEDTDDTSDETSHDPARDEIREDPESAGPAPSADAASEAPATVEVPDFSGPNAAPWWGEAAIASGEGGFWQVGPRGVAVVRTDREWRVQHGILPAFADTGSAGHEPVDASGRTVPMPADAVRALAGHLQSPETTRHGFRDSTGPLHVQPALADRPIVIQPDDPLMVPAGEAITLYVSTPLWVRVAVGPEATTLQEFPSRRLSDTWFGPNTQQGDLCYAARTAGRLDLDLIPRRYHRVITPITVRNRGTEALPVERVQLPSKYLSLYEPDDRFLWTDALTLARESDDEGASVKVEKGAPPDIPDAHRLHPPREAPKSGLVMSTFRTLGQLFGQSS